MSYLTKFDEKYRVVLEGCGTLGSSTKVDSDGVILSSSDFSRGGGVLITTEDIKAGILRDTKGAAFDSLEEAQAFAFDLISSDPESKYQIVKGLIRVEYVYDQEYWAEEERRERNRHMIVNFLICITISSSILFLATPLLWASFSLLLCVVIGVLFRGQDFLGAVFFPVGIAVLSSLLYRAVY